MKNRQKDTKKINSNTKMLDKVFYTYLFTCLTIFSVIADVTIACVKWRGSFCYTPSVA